MLAYAPYRRTGTLSGFGLGALTYPSWIPESTHVTGAALDNWKKQVAFAQGLFDVWHRNAQSAKQDPGNPSAASWQAIANRYATYLTPSIALNSGDPKFWTQTPERLADFADITAAASRHGGFHSSTSFTPGAFISNIPVVGDVVNIVEEAAAAPFKIAIAIGSGARLDHVALGALKDQLKIAKDVAPYAATVVSLVPGIGSGAAAAIGMGAALAEGRSITEAVKAGVRGAIPGGPLVQAGFDAAMKVASGENVGQVALETARSQLPATAQKAFDIGLAVATGEKIQTALAKGLASLAPGQMQTILAAGEHALTTVPGLSDAIKSVAPGAATQGFKLASGLLSQAGINEKALTAARSALAADVRQGFDAALKTQESHVAWLANVTGTTAAAAAAPAAPAPAPLEPPKRAAAPAPAKPPAAPLEPPKRAPATAVVAGAYAPYPKMGALSGPPPDCHSLGAPITNMSGGMRHAGLSAVNGSGGRSRMVHGPDGNDYLFALENGTLSARQCFSGGALSQEWTGVSGLTRV